MFGLAAGASLDRGMTESQLVNLFLGISAGPFIRAMFQDHFSSGQECVEEIVVRNDEDEGESEEGYGFGGHKRASVQAVSFSHFLEKLDELDQTHTFLSLLAHECWAAISPIHWSTDHLSTGTANYITYPQSGSIARAVHTSYTDDDHNYGERFAPPNGRFGNVDAVETFSKQSINGRSLIEVEVLRKGTKLNLGIGRRRSFLSDVDTSVSDELGDSISLRVRHTSSNPTTAKLKGSMLGREATQGWQKVQTTTELD